MIRCTSTDLCCEFLKMGSKAIAVHLYLCCTRTKSTKQVLFEKFTATQLVKTMSHVLWIPNAHYLIHYSPQLGVIPSHKIKSAPSCTTSIRPTLMNQLLPSPCPSLSSCPLPSGFPTKIAHSVISGHLYACYKLQPCRRST